jgi:uncharacterized repeat protein (TIGR03803 family)
MKPNIQRWFLPSLLMASIGFMLAGRAAAQTFMPLYSFSAIDVYGTNGDGDNPEGGLILAGDTLYGTTFNGGNFAFGTVFAVHTDGTGFTNLYNFTGGTDGGQPMTGLILSGHTLYGTTYIYGGFGNGTVFAINTDGACFTNVYNFTAFNGSPSNTNSDGANPEGELILSGDTLYGTAYNGGLFGYGAVFSVKTNGECFTNLYNFTGASDGGNPQAGLLLADGSLYGTTYFYGGADGNGGGTIFSVTTNYCDPDLTPLTPIHTFSGTDGANSQASLVLAGDTLYGTAGYGGKTGDGTIFSVNTNGNSFSNLYTFSYTGVTDGAQPYGGLVLAGDTLYGAAYDGGSSNDGTIYALNTNGARFRVLYNFSAVSGSLLTNSDGANPEGGLILSGATLYGTAVSGGTAGDGTVFALQLPQLAISVSGINVILTWPTNAGTLVLTSATNLSTANWNLVSPGPTVVNGENVVTNAIGAAPQFYRLSQ